MKKQQYDKVVTKMKEFIEPGEEVKEAFSARGTHPYHGLVNGNTAVHDLLQQATDHRCD